MISFKQSWHYFWDCVGEAIAREPKFNVLSEYPVNVPMPAVKSPQAKPRIKLNHTRNALALFASCIKSGEEWSQACERFLNSAQRELADIEATGIQLTLAQLAANAEARSPHAFPKSTSWTLMEWAGCTQSEAGEFFNWVKKLDRDSETATPEQLEVMRGELAHEAADILAYLLQNCARHKIDLYRAYITKHNLVCDKTNTPQYKLPTLA